MFAIHPTTRVTQLGITFIELLIAMTITLLLLGVMLNTYLANMRSQRLQTALTHMAYNALKISKLLQASIDQAGHIGCARLRDDFPTVLYPPYALTDDNKLTGKSHEITLRMIDLPGAVLKENMKDNESMILSTDTLYSPGDVLMVSDCTRAEMFRVAQRTVRRQNQKIVTTRPLHYRFKQHAEVGKYTRMRYYVKNKILFREIEGKSVELVQGIKQLTFYYTVHRNGTWVDLPYQAVSDWKQVAAVAIDCELWTPLLQNMWHFYVPLNGAT